MAYIVTQACIDHKDKSCIQECPVDCIYEGDAMVYINPAECVDCGACEPVCPHDAIVYESDIKNDQKIFISINKEFFDKIGNPGSSIGKDFTSLDHPKVKELRDNA